MKHLILTFFLVILCYSLFFDKTGNPAKDDIKPFQEKVSIPTSPDSVNCFVISTPAVQRFPHDAYAGTYLPVALY